MGVEREQRAQRAAALGERGGRLVGGDREAQRGHGPDAIGRRGSSARPDPHADGRRRRADRRADVDVRAAATHRARQDAPRRRAHRQGGLRRAPAGRVDRDAAQPDVARAAAVAQAAAELEPSGAVRDDLADADASRDRGALRRRDRAAGRTARSRRSSRGAAAGQRSVAPATPSASGSARRGAGGGGGGGGRGRRARAGLPVDEARHLAGELDDVDAPAGVLAEGREREVREVDADRGVARAGARDDRAQHAVAVVAETGSGRASVGRPGSRTT